MKKTLLKAASTLIVLAVMTAPIVQSATVHAQTASKEVMKEAPSSGKENPPAAALHSDRAQDRTINNAQGNTKDDTKSITKDTPKDNAKNGKTDREMNLALLQPAFASGNEKNELNSKLAVDGQGSTRWSSALKDNQWFYVDLGKKTDIDRVVIRWHTPAKSYKILVSDDAKHWKNVNENDGMIQCKGGVETVDFTPIQARYVKFQGIKRAPVKGVLYGYSFYEFEVYQLRDLQRIVDNVSSAIPVKPGQTKLDWSAAQVPEGYRVSLYGSDRVQVIDMEGNIREPLVDAKVNLIIQVEDKKNPGRKLLSGNMTVIVPGQHKQTPDRNAEPDVIPSLREWYGHTGSYVLSKSSRIVVDPKDQAALQNAAELTRKDLQDITGYDLQIVNGEPSKGDLFLSINPSLAWLGDEGNLFNVDQYVSITSASAKGVFFGTRTALQIIKQHPDRTIPKGEARDYPKYEQRGIMIDVARKFYTIDFLRSYVKLLSWYKMNTFQIHLNDVVGTPFGDGTTAAFRLESTTYPGLPSPNGYYTKQEFKDLQLLGMEYGVNVIPEIDTPGHSRAFTAYNPALGNDRTLDISKPETVQFVKSLLDEYLDGSDPTFVGPDINIGTDEYAGDVEVFRGYMDTLIKYINGKGKHPHLWGGLTQYNGSTPISTDATMDIWRESYGSPQQAADLGYDIVNAENAYMYIVPTMYRDYPNTRFLYNEWEPVKWATTTLPFGHPRVKGGMFCLWNDASEANGVSMDDSHERLLPGIQVVSEKMWTGTRDDRSFERFEQRKKIIGEAPNANLSHKITVNNDINSVIQYTFENGIKDDSGNHFDGKGVNVNVTQGKYDNGIRLNGGKSYIETPVEAVGFDWTVSMWVNPDPGNPNDAVLMESPVGTLKLKQGTTGKLGFTKEHYNSTFNYAVPEGKWTHLTLKGDNKGVTLFVNLDEYVERMEEKYPKMNTLVLPTLRIGSQTNAFKGVLDNVMIYNKAIELLSSKNLALHQSTESSKTESPSFPSGKAVDGDISPSSRWSSAYADDAWFIVDLGAPKDISKVNIKWQAAYATKYQLLVSTNKKNWTNVSGREGIINSKGNMDSITFDPQQARYVKFQGIKRATAFGNSFFEFEVYGSDSNREYKQLIAKMEKSLNQIDNNEKTHKLLLQFLNRYPYDAAHDLRPMEDLINRLQVK